MSDSPLISRRAMRLRGVLNRSQVEVCALYFFEGRSYDDIARYFGVGRSAIEKKVARIVEKLVAAGFPAPRRLQGKKREPRIRTADKRLSNLF